MHRLRENKYFNIIDKITFIIIFLIAPAMDAFENIFLLILLSNFELTTINFINSLGTLGKIVFFYSGWILMGILVIANIVDIFIKWRITKYSTLQNAMV
jgi:hypothetical protein